MEQYAGLGVSLEATSVCVVDGAGHRQVSRGIRWAISCSAIASAGERPHACIGGLIALSGRRDLRKATHLTEAEVPLKAARTAQAE